MSDARWRREEVDRLLAFGSRCEHPRGGAAWLSTRGEPDLSRPLSTWITARMAHVYSIGHALGREEDQALATRTLSGLTGPSCDEVHGGWFPQIDPDGSPGRGKSSYDHAFVLLASSSAVQVGLPGAEPLLERAMDQFLRFRDHRGLVLDAMDTTQEQEDPYRGLNALMHGVEAMLATWDATGDRLWLEWAHHGAEFVVELVKEHGHRLPEHFDHEWRPDLRYNLERPDDPFKPYGATLGHSFEWARLLVTTGVATGDHGLLGPAEQLYSGAADDGWEVDGAAGFVYTVDWDGTPVVRDRMHWVVAEALSAAAVLEQRTGRARYGTDQRRWWDFVREHVVDRRGSWHHQLSPDLVPIATTWPGSPDLYHAVTACLTPSLPLGVGTTAGVLRTG